MNRVRKPVKARSGFDWRWVGARLLLLIPAIQLYVTLASVRAPEDSDYNILYVHAEMARSNETLYWAWPEYGPHFGTSGLRFPADRVFYPPFLTPGLSLVTRWGIDAFANLWFVLLWAAYWVYAGALAKLAHGRVRIGPTVAWGVALFLLTGRSAQSAVNLGNVDPILWAIFGLALAYPAARGIGFMSMALVKLYGVWPLVFAAARREWRTVRAAGATLLGACLLVALILGPTTFVRESLAWFQYMLPVGGQGTFNDYNISISFFGLRVARWLGWWDYTAGPLPGSARTYLTLMGIAAPVITGWLLRRSDRRLQYALIVCAAVFFGPLAWNFYSALLLAPIAIWFGMRSEATDDERANVSASRAGADLVPAEAR